MTQPPKREKFENPQIEHDYNKVTEEIRKIFGPDCLKMGITKFLLEKLRDEMNAYEFLWQMRIQDEQDRKTK